MAAASLFCATATPQKASAAIPKLADLGDYYYNFLNYSYEATYPGVSPDVVLSSVLSYGTPVAYYTYYKSLANYYYFAYYYGGYASSAYYIYLGNYYAYQNYLYPTYAGNLQTYYATYAGSLFNQGQTSATNTYNYYMGIANYWKGIALP